MAPARHTWVATIRQQQCHSHIAQCSRRSTLLVFNSAQERLLSRRCGSRIIKLADLSRFHYLRANAGNEDGLACLGYDLGTPVSPQLEADTDSPAPNADGIRLD